MDESRTTDIEIPYPEAVEHHLVIRVAVCRLKVGPNDGRNWIEGSYQGPLEALPITISRDGGTVTIAQQKESWNVSRAAGRDVPSFDLTLGREHPYALTLETGASANDLDLGGLPLSRMAVKHGAGKLVVDFATPNPCGMSRLELASGAGAMWVRNLANADFAEMAVKGGAASYKFDFGGVLKRDARVDIETGVAEVEIVVPATTAVTIAAAANLGSVEIGDGFTKKEGSFWTEAALAGTTPVLAIHASVTLGSLKLTVA
jgi:hypothetical protein